MRRIEQIQQELKLFDSMIDDYESLQRSVSHLLDSNRKMVGLLRDELALHFPEEMGD